MLARSGATPTSVFHQSVLLAETIDLLAIQPNGRYVDGTLGSGGHARAILERCAPAGRLLGLDVDRAAIARASRTLAVFAGRVTLVRSNFDRLDQVAETRGFLPVNGVLLDLGVSSPQLADPAYGLSFQRDDPLDMRLDPSLEESAADIVNTTDEVTLANLIYTYGEERASRRIARAIVRSRPIVSTGRLAAIVERALGGRTGRIHPATRTFQALRIVVNDELGALERGINAAIQVLRPGGRLAIISFHSLEDRIVKRQFAAEAKGCICPPQLPVCQCGKSARLRLVTRHPIEPGQAETAENPRARSAKLRVAERVAA